MVKEKQIESFEIYKEDQPHFLDLVRVLMSHAHKKKDVPHETASEIVDILFKPGIDFMKSEGESIANIHKDSFSHFKGNPEYDFTVKGAKKTKNPSKLILFSTENPYYPSSYTGTRPLTHIFHRVIVGLHVARKDNPNKLDKHTKVIRFCYFMFKDIINGNEYKMRFSTYKLVAMSGSIAFASGWRYNNDCETDISTLFEKSYPSIKKKKAKK